jgi:hypothetical protein
MEFSMTGQEKSDLLIQVTACIVLTVFYYLSTSDIWPDMRGCPFSGWGLLRGLAQEEMQAEVEKVKKEALEEQRADFEDKLAEYEKLLVNIFYLIVVGGNRSTWIKPPTCRKSLTNFIT